MIEQLEKVQTTYECKYDIREEVKLLKALAAINSPSYEEDLMINFLDEQLTKLADEVYKDEFGNLIAVKGTLLENECYPCVVAHMDNVFNHKEIPKFRIDKIKGGYTKVYSSINNKQVGTGFDDKNGIFIALKLLEKLPKLKVIFTVAEEVGAIGASKLDPDIFNDVGYCLEGDRKGNSDVITSIWDFICSTDFLVKITPVMNKYGYSENDGMLTDVAAIREFVPISCINYSVGYYKLHSDAEYTIVEDLLKALDFATECIETLGYNLYEHEISYNKQSKYNSAYYDYGFDDFNYNGYSTKELIDLSSEFENRRTNKYSGYMCTCGEELEEKEHTFYCPFCNKHFIYDYRY